MAKCAHPGCNAQVRPPRLVCNFHWATLDAAVRAKIRGLLAGQHDRAAAAVVLQDHYLSER